MKKFYLFALLTSVSISFVKSQNYSAILQGQIIYFNSSNQSFHISTTYSPIKALQFDSAEVVPNGTIYYNFNTYRDTAFLNFGTPCLDIDAPSWIGWKVYSRNDGMQIFFNFSEDSIFLNTSAQNNNAWHFYNLSDSSYIEATVTNTSYMTYSGITDSVKIISLQAKDSTGNPIANIFNSKEIWLSENNGLLLFYQVSDFPLDSTSIFLYPNFTLPTRGQFYDFNVGDEFQYGGYCQGAWSSASPHGETIKYLNKYYSLGFDTVFYVVQTIYVSYTLIQNPWPQWVPSYTSSVDTGYFTHLSDPIDSLLPEENLTDHITDVRVYRAKIDTAMYFGRLQINSVSGFTGHWSPDSCIQINHFEPVYYEFTSGAGIGMIFSSSDESSIVGNYCETELFYYKKGNEVYGTPGVFTNLNPIQNFDNKITISPNPASKRLTVSSIFPLTTAIKIYDTGGRQLKNIPVSNQLILDFDLSDLNNGVYFLMLQSGQEIFKKKFVILR